MSLLVLWGTVFGRMRGLEVSVPRKTHFKVPAKGTLTSHWQRANSTRLPQSGSLVPPNPTPTPSCPQGARSFPFPVRNRMIPGFGTSRHIPVQKLLSRVKINRFSDLISDPEMSTLLALMRAKNEPMTCFLVAFVSQCWESNPGPPGCRACALLPSSRDVSLVRSPHTW